MANTAISDYMDKAFSDLNTDVQFSTNDDTDSLESMPELTICTTPVSPCAAPPLTLNEPAVDVFVSSTAVVCSCITTMCAIPSLSPVSINEITSSAADKFQPANTEDLNKPKEDSKPKEKNEAKEEKEDRSENTQTRAETDMPLDLCVAKSGNYFSLIVFI